MNESIDAKLKEVVARNVRRVLKSEDIKEDSHIFNDLGCDSACLIQLVIDIENEFGFEFDDEYIGFDMIEKYSELKKYVESKTQK